MMLKNKIQRDLVTALKNKNSQLLSVLRFLMAAIKNKEIELQKELSDEDIVTIIQKQVKELKEAKELFLKGDRTDLASQNDEQISLLQAYLPVQLPDSELETEIKKIIEKNQDVYQKNPKAIIGVCIKELKGKAPSDKIINILNKI
ncbi:hypothetical protein A3J15_01565 [Candidatus Roizmanbacteria bacterium RIFCSPLOWO2_02_FULL_38_10]|uniref:Glutamyl-tRNA amidotransferase n=1 Tax=Candidatus Roizmanbacteria bacterium RIFCSPLOWO2_02_FULL_38_10 TaxID=1802074 RepID=A0A1F7JN50_9BACT|nr:MAG: hypothetical protein A3J15_01565 [Candidatus Roizmanbacteria bacterium RIFCSPLOWO2_02_FULL_38_10]